MWCNTINQSSVSMQMALAAGYCHADSDGKKITQPSWFSGSPVSLVCFDVCIDDVTSDQLEAHWSREGRQLSFRFTGVEEAVLKTVF